MVRKLKCAVNLNFSSEKNMRTQTCLMSYLFGEVRKYLAGMEKFRW